MTRYRGIVSYDKDEDGGNPMEKELTEPQKDAGMPPSEEMEKPSFGN